MAGTIIRSATLALTLVIVHVASLLAAQSGSIEGYVRDANSDASLGKARVQLADGSRSVEADASGWFRLPDVGPGQLLVRVEAAGYAASIESIEIYAGSRWTVSFQLLPLAEIVQGLLVEAERRSGAQFGGGSVGVVRGGEAKAPLVGSATDLLAGKIPGVFLERGSGNSAARSRIVVRGFKSAMQSNSPAIYIDGIRMNPDPSFDGGLMTLDQLDPMSVDRIEVLRGASAGSTFGHDTSNGVILIWTKKGAG